jgi:site-specific DNA-methyltransferase (adenine-specific)
MSPLPRFCRTGRLLVAHSQPIWRGVIEREEAQIGVLISMEAPTKPMLKEAAEAGFYKPPGLEERWPLGMLPRGLAPDGTGGRLAGAAEAASPCHRPSRQEFCRIGVVRLRA